MSDRKDKGVTVYEGQEYGPGFPKFGWNAQQVLEWVQEKVSKIPAEYMSKSWIIFSAEDNYDSHIARISIGYCRPETDEEMAQRLAAEAMSFDEKMRAELEVLAKLKAKYER